MNRSTTYRSWHRGSAMLVGGLLLLIMVGCGEVGGLNRVVILEGSQTYEERPESERLWTGVLRENQRGDFTPDQRPGLYYGLETEGDVHRVYTEEIIGALENLLNREVVIEGKLLSPLETDVVASEELWPATVERIATER